MALNILGSAMSFLDYEKGRSEHNLDGDVPWRWGYRETHESLVNVNGVRIQTVHEVSLKS